MCLKERKIAGVLIGLFFYAQPARADLLPLLSGPGKLAVSLESELFSRDMTMNGSKERLRVTRQALQAVYGVTENLDLFVSAGLGKVAFQEADVNSQTRALTGIGFRGTLPFGNGYFTGASAQYRFGSVSKFEQNDATLTIKDQWSEQDARLFVGSKDMVSAPEPDLRFYTGVRFSNRSDNISSQVGFSGTARQKSSFGGMVGMDYLESKIFRFNLELGGGDRTNITARFGLLFF